MYVKTNAMERLICAVMFRGEAPPVTWYVGLGRGPLPGETSTLANVTEIVGPGYARQPLQNGPTDFPDLIVQDGDWKVGSRSMTWAAVGGDWQEIEYAFLTDSPDASHDDTGTLYAVVSVSPFVNHDTEFFHGTFEYQDS